MKPKRRRRWALWIVLFAALAGAGLVVRKIVKRGRLPAALVAVVDDTGPRKPQPLEAAELIYDQKLSPDWEDWGWGPHRLTEGPAKIMFAGYGGWLLHHAGLPWRYGGLSFRFRAPDAWGAFLQVTLRQAGTPDGTFPIVPISAHHIASVEGWSEVLVDWKELNPERRPFDSVLIGARVQVASEWAELDRVMLTKAPAQDARKGSLSVLCNEPSHPISELIYGSSNDNWDSGQSAQRIGGNPLSRDNWEIGAWNTGNDWFFENIGQKTNMFETLEDASKNRHSIAMVVPMLGFIAKDQSSVGFPRAKFPTQRKFDPYRAEAGDGFSPDGKPLAPGDPSQTSVPAPPELIAGWARKVLAQDARYGSRSIRMYILDNEPTLWDTTHRDVHPQPLGYDELFERTIKYASAIRDADPQAVIAGPAEWGYTGYEYSAIDRVAGVALRPDRRAHGDVPLVAWYLKKLADYEKTTGKRLLDVFDLHFYPAAQGIYGGDAGTDPTASDLRLRSTRALWDPDYLDESWINDKLRLIPRMKDWVRENYPGLKLSLGEWSFGAEQHISGGLATVEALGRFGQQGLDSAFLWGDLKPGSPAYWAFRGYRNFDGKGGRFLDVSVPTREIEGVSLFASRDAAMSRLVLVLVNRDQSIELTARVALKGCGNALSSRMFSYAAASPGLSEGPAETHEDSVSVKLEPFSFAVIEVKLGENRPH